LWVAVRRAVFGEVIAAEYVTDARTAWRLRAARDSGGAAEEVLSLDQMTAEGFEGFAYEADRGAAAGLLGDLADAFTRAGWPEGLARRLVHQIAITAPARRRPCDAATGWRHLAIELGIQPWQARRATLLVLGSAGCPGLAERVVRMGADVLRSEEVERALRETLRTGRRRCQAA
jgi:hypothetical protein